jgi:choline dehydrogenase-like flavoprotein
MIIDLAGYTGEDIRCDLCIIGAGAAGITIAREFQNGKHKVCLLESGGLEYEDQIQDLYSGANIGLPYYSLASSRLRFFGGTTNHWA